MAYSDPRTWVTGELVTAALMNAQLRDNLDAVIEGTTGAYVNAVTGPHAIGGSTVDYVRLGLTGAFTSGGASTLAFGLYTSGVLTGHSGDSAAIAGIKANNSIVTAGNCTTIAQLWVSEPQITVGAGSVTNSATVYIESAATEATNDYALWVAAGTTLLDGALAAEGGAVFNDTSGDVDFRIESNDNDNAINVDGGLNTLGIFRAADLDYYQTIIAGSFTSGGASSVAAGLITETALTAHSGDTTRVTGQSFTSSITTPAASFTVALMAQTYIKEPNITLGSGSAVTSAASLYVADAPTEATNNYALWVDGGATQLDGTLDVAGAVTLNDAGADVDLRAETSGDEYAFTINGGTNNVGIGEADPGHKFTVSGTGGTQGSLAAFDTSAEKIVNL